MNTEKQAIDQNIPHTATTAKQPYNIQLQQEQFNRAQFIIETAFLFALNYHLTIKI